eukprot:3151258-Rhodomonas_salina.3
MRLGSESARQTNPFTPCTWLPHHGPPHESLDSALLMPPDALLSVDSNSKCRGDPISTLFDQFAVFLP